MRVDGVGLDRSLAVPVNDSESARYAGRAAGPAPARLGQPEPRVGIVPGTGVVVRFGPTIGVFAANTSPDEPFTAAWLERLSRWERAGARTAEDMAWEAAELLVAHRRTAPAWGAAIRLADGYLVLLYGAVRAQLDSPSGRTQLCGTDDLTWVDRRVTGQITRVALALSKSGDIIADPRWDLSGGLVPTGSGLVLTVPTDRAPIAPGPAPSSTGLPVPITGRQPSWTVLPASDASEATHAVIVTAGVLVADDGSRTILDREYVFGRDPSQDPAVVRGHATPIRVDDPDNLVSRVQAHVVGSATTVTVRDTNSANGTYIAPPGAATWTRIGTFPTLLPLGWSLRLGARVYVHHTAVTSAPASENP